MSGAPSWADWVAYCDALSLYVFLNWAVASSLLLAGALLVARLPRLRPSTRHGVLAAALFAAALAPATMLHPASSRARTEARRHVPQAAALQASLETGTAVLRRPALLRVRSGSSAEAAPLSPGWLLLLSWAAAVLVRLAALAHGTWLVRRWLRYAVPADRNRVYDACGYAVADIPVLESGSVRVPCVCGIRAHRILLPLGLAGTLDPRALGHVLLHEEAHVRRRDPLVFFFAECAHALLLWNPLAALVRKEMTAAAEEACDAHVLARGVEGAGYARTLLAVLEQAAPARPRLSGYPIGVRGGDLRRRVVQILGRAPRPSRLSGALAGAGVAAVAGLSLGAEVGRRPDLPRPAAVPVTVEVRSRPPLHMARAGVRRVRRRSAPPAGRPLELTAAAPMPGPLAPGAWVAPGLAGNREQEPRDFRSVVLVLDNSSSMRPYRDEALRQLIALVGELSERDRFNVIAFDTEVRAFAEMPVAACEESRLDVEAWLADLPEASGTDVAAGVALALAEEEVTSVVLFSDRETAQGTENWRRLTDVALQQNRWGARVFAVTLGVAPIPTLDEPAVAPAPARVQALDALDGGLNAAEPQAVDLRVIDAHAARRKKIDAEAVDRALEAFTQ